MTDVRERFNVYLVGGAVRDELLGREVKDRDWVVVGSNVEAMLEMGYSMVGADFPVFLCPKTGEEYALARTEEKVAEGYHGFTVNAHPGVTLEEDLLRRDLTINAIARDENGDLVDPYGGVDDLRAGRIRAVNPTAFVEDPLRVVRAIRFASRYLSFFIEATTAELMRGVVEAGHLNQLSTERLWAELRKMYEDAFDSTGMQGIQRFWGLVVNLNLHRHVKFFNEFFDQDVAQPPTWTFAPPPNFEPHWATDATDVMRASLAVHLNYQSDATVKRVMPMLNRMDTKMRDIITVQGATMDNDTEVLYDAMNRVRMVQADRLNDADLYSRIAMIAGLNYTHWEFLITKLLEINADNFPDVTGPALGSLIREARWELFQTLMEF